jgi:predicted transcriptional regulator
MDLLWSAGEPRTVRAVFEELERRRRIAYTTVMTVMDNLHRKGWLCRELVGRAYLYEAVRSREAHNAELMGEALADSLDPAATLIHFVERMSPEEARLLSDALARATRGTATQGSRDDASGPSQRKQPAARGRYRPT